jgi:hypothetical protein
MLLPLDKLESVGDDWANQGLPNSLSNHMFCKSKYINICLQTSKHMTADIVFTSAKHINKVTTLRKFLGDTFDTTLSDYISNSYQ